MSISITPKTLSQTEKREHLIGPERKVNHNTAFLVTGPLTILKSTEQTA